MKRLLYIAVVLAAAAAAVGTVVWSQWTSYHDFEGKCTECHLTEPDRRGGVGDTGIFVRNMSAMCLRCHPSIEELSHPVEVKPSMKVPKEFPLDWKGHLTCVSCHPAHQKGFFPFRLRVPDFGEMLCSMCHSRLGSDMHKMAMGTAHVTATTATRFAPWELGRSLDELSLKCLACHDAVFGEQSLVEDRTQTNIFHRGASIGVSHPIGVSYFETKRRYKGAYRAASELPPQIKLFGGLVGCGSCHNPFSKRHFDLVMSNEGSALCLACHVK